MKIVFSKVSTEIPSKYTLRTFFFDMKNNGLVDSGCLRICGKERVLANTAELKEKNCKNVEWMVSDLLSFGLSS